MCAFPAGNPNQPCGCFITLRGYPEPEMYSNLTNPLIISNKKNVGMDTKTQYQSLFSRHNMK